MTVLNHALGSAPAIRSRNVQAMHHILSARDGSATLNQESPPAGAVLHCLLAQDLIVLLIFTTLQNLGGGPISLGSWSDVCSNWTATGTDGIR